MGPQTSRTLKELDLTVDFESQAPGLNALVDALISRLNES